MRKNVLPAFAAAILLLASGAAMALPLYTITDLGVLSGGNRSVAADINDRGQVVGCSGYDCVNVQGSAFLWENGIMTDLGNLPGGTGVNHALGINNSGQVVGTSADYADVNYVNRAFLWQNGVMNDLGHLLEDDSGGAEDINNNGQVVGGSGSKAFSWQSSVMTDLGLPPGSSPRGINDYGQVAGTNSYTSGPHAFLWQSGAMTFLGSLPGGGGHSYAEDINNIGQVVGQSGGSGAAEAGYARAFLWDESAGMRNLGLLSGADASVAHGINDKGQVVGESFSLSGAGGAFLWDDGLGMLNLNDLLIDAVDWSLWEATAINNSGQIVGSGLHYGAQRAFLLTPVDAPPATDIQYININSNGEITGESFNPDYPTVVVTHGWQPEADNPLSQSFPLADVSQAVAARALNDEQPLNLITYQWAAAYTRDDSGLLEDMLSDIFSGGTVIRYNAAAYGTKSAGNLLGNRLETLFEDTGYTGPVHMIGHSFGTAVNAWAVDYAASLDVDQFTILDAPNDVFGCAAEQPCSILFPISPPMQFTSDWFNTKLPGGQVTYVDNFYGSGQGSLDPLDAPAVGAPILGAAGGGIGSNGGKELTGVNHGEVHEIYSQRVEDDLFWTSPIFGLDNIHFRGRPGPQTWRPNPDGGLIAIGGELSDYSTWAATQGSVEIATLGLDVGGPYSEIIAMVLQPHSPVSITRPFDIPVGATLLSFDFGFLDPGTGEFLQLFFDDILLWETPWMNDLVGELLNAVVPIGSLAGRSGELTFLLDSTTGDASARAFIANFEVMGIAALTADPVPEPGTLLLLGTGLLGLIRVRYVSARQAGGRISLAA